MASDGEGSVTRWIGKLKAGDPEAAELLCGRYLEALARLARARLRGSSRAAEDEEDVALSSFDSFLAGAARGRFPRLDDRHDLWRILVTIATRKAIDQARRQRRRKRGGGRVVGAADLDDEPFDRIVAVEPTPEFAALVAEECGRRLDGLRDETLRRIALLKMEGYPHEEIAARLGLGLRSVVRKLDLIRKAWSGEGSP